MKKKNLLLIGYGKLLQGIIPKFNTNFFNICVVTRTQKDTSPASDDISYIQLDVLNNKFSNELVNKIDICIFTLPPIELEKFNNIISQFTRTVKFIFTSSISVYIKNGNTIDENSPTLTNQLTECENSIKKYFNQFCILRLGGLYGDNRHPIYSIKNKRFHVNFNDNIHLVHHEDVQDIILKILNEDNFDNEIYNIISDLRISKKEYYNFIASKLELELNEINESSSSNSEFINNISNLKSKNKFKLNYKNPLDYQGIKI